MIRRLKCLGCTVVILLMVLAGFLFLTPLGRDILHIAEFGYQANQSYSEKDRNYSSNCMENLKKIGQGLQLYLTSNEAFPPANRWMDELQSVIPLGNDVKKEDRDNVFKCPKASSGYGYAFNTALSSKWADEIPKLNEIAMVFDSPLNERNAHSDYSLSKLPNPPRHEKSNNVLFGDGSVKAIESK